MVEVEDIPTRPMATTPTEVISIARLHMARKEGMKVEVSWGDLKAASRQRRHVRSRTTFGASNTENRPTTRRRYDQ